MKANRVHRKKAIIFLISPCVLIACKGEQSALHPASEGARQVSQLIWIMTAAAILIWLVMMGITLGAILGKHKPKTEHFADRFILIGGVVLPTTLLGLLLTFGLSLLPRSNENEPSSLRIEITGEQFWWRVRYETADGRRFETANEIHLPLEQELELTLQANDVIHSFWIPSLGGKLDMIPGRSNILRITPSQLGVFRGVCAEFCGMSHALMAFEVVVEPPADFERWLKAEAAPARDGDPTAFEQAGCGACHQIRGLSEAGSVGPDLTHFASRRMMAAGLLPITREALSAWLEDPQKIKPDARMPSYSDLPMSQRTAIIDLLMGLE